MSSLENVGTNVFIRTVIPILLLMGLGFFSRKRGILKLGDERVLSAFVYYFALPALFIVRLAETDFTLETLKFMFAGIIPVIILVMGLYLLYRVIGFSRDHLYLLILCSAFGSLSFFGIPFITFAFPSELGTLLATLSSASISPISVAISITVLELSELEEPTIWTGLKNIMRRFSRNPLIVSILIGILLSLGGISLPTPLSASLRMLSSTTSAVALFMLGAFLFGREYTKVLKSIGLSLLRIVILPIITLIVTIYLELSSIERSVLVLMHSMPIAISMIILSERYDFHKDIIASIILVSSLGAGLYLNLWLLLLGYN